VPASRTASRLAVSPVMLYTRCVVRLAGVDVAMAHASGTYAPYPVLDSNFTTPSSAAVAPLNPAM
jgi:hypothetical protein